MFRIAARITVVLAAAILAGSASAQSAGVGFTLAPKHVVQGEDARLAVSVRPSGTRCTLSVRYQGGAQQPGLAAAVATGGRAGWTWHVPTDVQAGVAKATVRCNGAGTGTRSLVIVGRLVEPKITVTKQGFSIRPGATTGSRLSYGLILHNGSTTKDAIGVSVQTNFVMADNNLLGTDTQHVSGIVAGADYALGHMVSFPGAAPIVRLEVVIQVDTFAAPSLHDPTLANIHLVPQAFEPRWLGSVEGELQNTGPGDVPPLGEPLRGRVRRFGQRDRRRVGLRVPVAAARRASVHQALERVRRDPVGASGLDDGLGLVELAAARIVRSR